MVVRQPNYVELIHFYVCFYYYCRARIAEKISETSSETSIWEVPLIFRGSSISCEIFVQAFCRNNTNCTMILSNSSAFLSAWMRLSPSAVELSYSDRRFKFWFHRCEDSSFIHSSLSFACSKSKLNSVMLRFYLFFSLCVLKSVTTVVRFLKMI